MTDCQILYAIGQGRCVIRMVGDIRYPLARGLDAAIRRACSDPETKEFLIDLREVCYIDSTNLGLLARIARWSIEEGQGRPTVVCENEDVNTLLRTLALDEVFLLVGGTASEPNGLGPVPEVGPDQEQMRLLMLEAHQVLSEINESNREEFRDVVELLSLEGP